MSSHVIYVNLCHVCKVMSSMSSHFMFVKYSNICKVMSCISSLSIYFRSCHVYQAMSYISSHVIYVMSFCLCQVIICVTCIMCCNLLREISRDWDQRKILNNADGSCGEPTLFVFNFMYVCHVMSCELCIMSPEVSCVETSQVPMDMTPLGAFTTWWKQLKVSHNSVTRSRYTLSLEVTLTFFFNRRLTNHWDIKYFVFSANMTKCFLKT